MYKEIEDKWLQLDISYLNKNQLFYLVSDKKKML